MREWARIDGGNGVQTMDCTARRGGAITSPEADRCASQRAKWNRATAVGELTELTPREWFWQWHLIHQLARASGWARSHVNLAAFGQELHGQAPKQADRQGVLPSATGRCQAILLLSSTRSPRPVARRRGWRRTDAASNWVFGIYIPIVAFRAHGLYPIRGTSTPAAEQPPRSGFELLQLSPCQDTDTAHQFKSTTHSTLEPCSWFHSFRGVGYGTL